jgi:hypothetical protein
MKRAIPKGIALLLAPQCKAEETAERLGIAISADRDKQLALIVCLEAISV